MWNLKKKNYTDELTKQKQADKDFDNKFIVVGGRTHRISHGTLLNVMWQPRWERSLGGEWIHG